jgi:hypothetical protein
MAARPLRRSPAPAAMKALIGLLTVATLLIGSGCAKQDWIDRTLVTVDVTGVWRGPMSQLSTGSGGEARLELQQQGPNVSGHMQIPAGTIVSGPITGTVAGDVFKFTDARGTLFGELTVNGDEMTGQYSGPMGARPISLRRENSIPPPASPPR